MKDHPTIIVDSREQRPLEFLHLPSERGTLQSGDYSIKGLEHDFAVERKSIPDLIGSCTRDRERFERELHRLRGFDFARLLVIGEPYEVARLAQNPKAIFSSLTAFECRWKIPVAWEPDPATAARLVERWAWFYASQRSRATGGKAEPCPIPAATVQGHTRAITAAISPLAPSKP
jgi:ERCC4-type nuclease